MHNNKNSTKRYTANPRFLSGHKLHFLILCIPIVVRRQLYILDDPWSITVGIPSKRSTVYPRLSRTPTVCPTIFSHAFTYQNICMQDEDGPLVGHCNQWIIFNNIFSQCSFFLLEHNHVSASSRAYPYLKCWTFTYEINHYICCFGKTSTILRLSRQGKMITL